MQMCKIAVSLPHVAEVAAATQPSIPRKNLIHFGRSDSHDNVQCQCRMKCVFYVARQKVSGWRSV